MRRRILMTPLVVSVAATAALLMAIGLASAATVSKSTPFTVTCTSTGQVCDQAYQQSFTTSSQLRLEFQSAYESCGSFSVAFFVDGAQVHQSAVLAPFQGTGVVDVSPVAHGTHLLEVRATGVPGGCNTGTLTSWGGRLSVTSTDDPPPPPPPDPEPEPGPSDEPPPPPAGPNSANDCKGAGWKAFGFKNQGQCVSSVQKHKKHRWEPPEERAPGCPGSPASDRATRPGRPGKR